MIHSLKDCLLKLFRDIIIADEAMGEILGVKIREDDNPILMVMEL